MTEENRIVAEVSAGELLDKIVILEIKRSRLTSPAQLTNVEREWKALAAERDRKIRPAPADRTAFEAAIEELREVNQTLWQIEDDIRVCEREGRFDAEFVELARGVYRTNDRRSALKRRLNEMLSSRLVEEKQYANYG
jgi:hypothetical protein